MELQEMIQGWRVNQEINLRLFDAIAPAYLSDRAAPRGRTVGEQWAHVSNVRVKWLEVKLPKLSGLPAMFPKEQAEDHALLREHLVNSALAFEHLLTSFRDGIKAKGRQQSLLVFYSYIIAHEAHHRGQIILHLKLSGHNLPSGLKFSLWDW